uniref:pituitary tumor-transforming gene 1 protein-interacting protein-like n=1 Tax=Styela clava TaxID=7725 RepID=UPI00193A343A|nr:pituitary tumor-transforming gene 1 protein-interacting protein-like [Styela clava]
MKCFIVSGAILLVFASCASAETSPCVNASIKSCEECLKVDAVKCMWCGAKNPIPACKEYPAKHVLPTNDDCPLSDARWGVCWLNFEALIISCSIIGGLLLIGITLCFCKCCGCCCFKKNTSRYQREEARLEVERQNRQMRQDARRQERKQRNDEIRRKYGLSTGGAQYQKFENE